MSIRLIALDMDGTTLQNDHESISPRTEKALRSAISRGILVVPATGRLECLLPPSVMGIGGIRYAVASNGAIIYDLQSGDVMHSSYLTQDKTMELLHELKPENTLIEIFQNGKIIAEKQSLNSALTDHIPVFRRNLLLDFHILVDSLPEHIREHGDRIEKINLSFVDPERREGLWKQLTDLGEVVLTSSIPDNIEINEIHANKGSALKRLCDSLDIAPQEVMAFGDNGNDIEMLKYADWSFAPANGTDAAKAAAKRVTAANDEDGVAIAIEAYALNK